MFQFFVAYCQVYSIKRLEGTLHHEFKDRNCLVSYPLPTIDVVKFGVVIANKESSSTGCNYRLVAPDCISPHTIMDYST